MPLSHSLRFFIVMPVYNVEPYIEKSIKSVLSQTYPRFQLIMVDDGSPDNSGSICDSFAAEDSRLTVIHKQNGGLISARQAGLRCARELCDEAENAYLLYLDSDDWLDPNTLEILARALEENPSDCLVYGFNRVMDGKILFSTADEPENTAFPVSEVYRKIFSDSIYNSLCRKAVCLARIPLTDYSSLHHISIGEDLLQTLDLLKSVRTVSFVSDRVYQYRVNRESMTQSVNYDRFDFEYTVSQSLLAFIREYAEYSDLDWKRQWTVLCGQFYRDVMGLLFSSHPWKRKRKWLKQLVASPYVTEELAPRVPYEALPRNQRTVLKVALKRRFGVLRAYMVLSKIKNKFF